MIENSSGYKKRQSKYKKVLSILIAITLVLAIMMLMLGDNIYSINDVIKVLSGVEIKGATFAIMKIRLPRMLAALFVGVAFGVSGCIFQTILRNPLASPDIIGISTGCSVGAVLSILTFGLSGILVSVISLVSGLFVAVLIYLLSRGSSFSGGRLILIGIGMQAFLNAIISYLLLKSNQYEISGAIRWLNGSLNGMSMTYMPLLIIVVVFFVVLTSGLTKQLQVLQLGDEFAISLGIRVNYIRVILILSSVILIAFATAVTGPIAFVAFLSAPIASRLVGGGSPKILASGLVGAILIMLGDLIGQFLFSTRFPVGVVTGLIGAPYMLYLLVVSNKKGN